MLFYKPDARQKLPEFEAAKTNEPERAHGISPGVEVRW